MNHLKYFNLFENVNNSALEKDLLDILASEFKDMYIKYDVSSVGKHKAYIRLINLRTKSYLTLNEVISFISKLNYYLKNNGEEIEKIIGVLPNEMNIDIDLNNIDYSKEFRQILITIK